MTKLTPGGPPGQLPTPGDPDRWKIIDRGMQSWGLAFRLSMILVAAAIPAAVALVIILLLRH